MNGDDDDGDAGVADVVVVHAWGNEQHFYYYLQHSDDFH